MPNRRKRPAGQPGAQADPPPRAQYRLSDDELADLALARFKPAEKGEDFVSLKVLAGRYFGPKAKESTAKRAIDGAFRKKLVKVVRFDPADVLPAITRNAHLEEQLERRFNLRRSAHVINWPPVNYKLPDDESEAEDVLAHALGAAAADDVKTYFDPKERIGIGAGRCCYRFSHVFRSKHADQKSASVRVYALAGNFNVRSQAAREKNVVVDSSLNA
ncbi:MAG TPA: sugar-binding domain-containing protein, partial [Polyangia bacterium]|nr:sugar-binding domain-containing protein [Polyangia bacterium]